MEFVCPFCDASPLEEAIQAGACDRCRRALVIDGFRLRRVIGRGGLGVVYEAVSPSGQRAAVKVHALLHEPSKERADAAWQAWEAFERGARVLMGLSHPLLPRVFAFGRAEPARLYLVREIFDGGTLDERIRSQVPLPGNGPVFTEVAAQLLSLLHYLHTRVPPVIHRDLKPANIMFRTASDWDPVLVDFDTVAAPVLQRSGLTVVGTLGYAAPEQLAGEATPASDLFGLGMTLLSLMTGHRPDTLPRRGADVDFEEAGVSELYPDMRRFLAAMVAQSPRDRPPSAAAALAELRAVRPEEPPEAPWPSPSPSSSPYWPLSNWMPLSVRLLVASVPPLLLLGGVAVLEETCHPPPEKQHQWAVQDCLGGALYRCRELRWELDSAAERAQVLHKGCELGDGDMCFQLASQREGAAGAAELDGLYQQACERRCLSCCAYACARQRAAGALAAAAALCQRGCDLHEERACAMLTSLSGAAAPPSVPR